MSALENIEVVERTIAPLVSERGRTHEGAFACLTCAGEHDDREVPERTGDMRGDKTGQERRYSIHAMNDIHSRREL